MGIGVGSVRTIVVGSGTLVFGAREGGGGRGGGGYK